MNIYVFSYFDNGVRYQVQVAHHDRESAEAEVRNHVAGFGSSIRFQEELAIPTSPGILSDFCVESCNVTDLR